MSDWINAVMFGVGLIAFTLGFSSIIMGFISQPDSGKAMQHRIEYGFFGITGLVVCLLMGYALA